MDIPTYWLSLAMGLACLLQLVFAARTFRLPPFPGRLSFALMILGSAWWEICVAIEHVSSQLDGKVFWSEFAWLGIITMPGAWALFIWNYVHGQYRPAARSLYWTLGVVAVTVWLLAITNDRHHLIYTSTTPIGTWPTMMVNFLHGPAYFAIAVVFYAVVLLSEAFIIYEIVRSRDVYRTHYLGLAAASLFPWFLNIGYSTRTIMLGTADLTPASFVVTNAIFLWLITRRNLFNLLPIAQGMLLDAVPDPVIVIDNAGRVADCNPAARQLLGQRPLKGEPVDALSELRDALAVPNAQTGIPGPREVKIGAPAQYFDLGQVGLTYANRAVGRLVLLRDITHRKETEAKLQTALADLQQQLSSNLALQQQLREEAIRDALTGLHNRRFFQEVAPVMLAESQRSGDSLAAAMIDIDHFKRLNDTHGHAAGDAVLRATGAFLRASVRQSDLVFRMGGEEFLILLPHTPGDQAVRRIDDWRAAFAAETMTYDGAALTATFSAGVAVFPENAAGIDELLSRADQALYRAKTGGRNRTAR